MGESLAAVEPGNKSHTSRDMEGNIFFVSCRSVFDLRIFKDLCGFPFGPLSRISDGGVDESLQKGISSPK